MDPNNPEFRRLRPFKGLNLEAHDLLDEQGYHRDNLHRHNLFLHGHGIVQGLQLELQQRGDRYIAVLQAGFGITRHGQQVRLDHIVEHRLETPRRDGMYMLWLCHVEKEDPESLRKNFDTSEQEAARIVETCAPELHPIDHDQPQAVALCRINVLLGRMIQVFLPVPRAGRQERAAESYLKPRVSDFIRLCRKILNNLLRTALLTELQLETLSFNNALISAEFLLIEEGTSDRVLYRTSGSLSQYAHNFFVSMPRSIDQIESFKEKVRKVSIDVPPAEQPNEIWLRWFDKFERLLKSLQSISDELEQTVEAQRRQ